MRYEPDWTQAPGWAQWWAFDENGKAYWFATKPEIPGGCAVWLNTQEAMYERDGNKVLPAWRESLRHRPQEEV